MEGERDKQNVREGGAGQQLARRRPRCEGGIDGEGCVDGDGDGDDVWWLWRRWRIGGDLSGESNVGCDGGGLGAWRRRRGWRIW